MNASTVALALLNVPDVTVHAETLRKINEIDKEIQRVNRKRRSLKYNVQHLDEIFELLQLVSDMEKEQQQLLDTIK